MISRVCRRCRTRYTGTRCPCLPAKRGKDAVARKGQRDFRRRLIAEQGEQCSFYGPEGRCPETRNLQAAHVSPYADDANFEAGALLCAAHHRLFDRRS